jgi:hypothetical protein
MARAALMPAGFWATVTAQLGAGPSEKADQV